LFFSPTEVAAVLGVRKKEFLTALQDDTSAVYMAYFKGKYLSEAEIRRSIIQQAKQGSSPAQSIALKLIEENDNKMGL
jgi:hypothetical protein